MRGPVWKGLLPLALALAAVLTGCGQPAAESLSPRPSEGVETSAPENSAVPTPKPIPTDGPYVYTDYSQLEDNSPRPDRYVRWHGEFTDHLIPSPDYGPLIPFSGDGAMEEWEVSDYGAQGLMTLDGKVVVDPVYSAVTQLCSGGDIAFGRPDTYYPAFLLSRYAGDGEGDLFNAYNDVSSQLCALDGSWVTEEYHFSYNTLCYGNGVQDGAIFALRDENILVLLDISNGKELFSAPLEGLGKDELNEVLHNVGYGDGRITLSVPIYDRSHGADVRYLRCWDLSGNEIFLPGNVDGIYSFSEGLCPARRTGGEGYAWGYLGLDGQWAIPPQFTDATSFDGGVALLGTHAHTLIDREGNILYETPTYDRCQKTGDYWYFCGYSGDAGLVLDKQGNEVNSPLLHGGYVDALNYGWAVMTNADGSYTLAKGEKSWPIPAGWGYAWAGNVTEYAIYLTQWTKDVTDNKPHWAIWKPESGKAPTVFSGNFDSLRTDPITGERYCVIYDDYSSGRYHITDLSGKTLFDGLSGWPRLYAGRCLTKTTGSNGKTVELRDQSGAVLFRRTWADPFG